MADLTVASSDRAFAADVALLIAGILAVAAVIVFALAQVVQASVRDCSDAPAAEHCQAG